MSKQFELEFILKQEGIKFQIDAEADGDHENVEAMLNVILEEGCNDKVTTINNIIGKFPFIRRGDVVHCGSSDYRNDGRLLWDGDKLIPLSFELDEYGHLPHTFTLNEFSLQEYFNKTIAHNNIRWIQINSAEDIIDIRTVLYNNNKMGKYFVVKIDKLSFKIVVPIRYLNCENKYELYDKLINDEYFEMEEHGNCLALELDAALIGLTNINDMYIIYSDCGTSYESEDELDELDEDDIMVTI